MVAEQRKRRSRGGIRERDGVFQVRVYVGIDPVTGQRVDLTGTAATDDEAEKLLTKFLAETDARRAARSKVNFGDAADRWLAQLDVEVKTAHEYAGYVRRTLRPAFGTIPLSRLDAQAIESLTDAHALAGWQSLDRGEIVQAWRHYAKSCDAAMATGSTPLYALALAKKAVVLSDVGSTVEGAEMSGRAREIGRAGSALVRSWLAAAHGEALAAAGQRSQCLRAFDRAYAMLPADCAAAEGPYIGLDTVHLTRWRGHALARVGDPDAVPVLTAALRSHDAEFTRAEAALRVDLMFAHLAADDTESATEQRQKAIIVADSVGSVRQRRRLADASACCAFTESQQVTTP